MVLAACGGTANDGSGGTDAAAPSTDSSAVSQPDDPTPQPATDGGSTGPQATEAPVQTGETASSSGVTFALVGGTEARFYVNEVLNGNPKEVIGITSLVDGTLVPDFA